MKKKILFGGVLFFIIIGLLLISLYIIFSNRIYLNDSKTIIKAGKYYIYGSIDDGKLTIDSDEDIELIFNNIKINNSKGPAIYIKSARSVSMTFKGSNKLNGRSNDKHKGVIYSKSNLLLNGSGKLEINAEDQNGIVSRKTLIINNGNMEIKTISTRKSDEVNTDLKGLKAQNIRIMKGFYSINTVNDGIHANNSILIKDGDYSINTSDDGIHANGTLTIEKGNINVENSFEGIEGHKININGGNINLNATNDGINASIGQEIISNDTSLNINDGEIYINSGADGIDSNGTLNITGGNILIDGSSNGIERPLESDLTTTITGGTLIGVGCCKNNTVVSDTTTQNTVIFYLDKIQTGNIKVGDISFNPKKQYATIIISSPLIQDNEKYDININNEKYMSFTQIRKVLNIEKRKNVNRYYY